MLPELSIERIFRREIDSLPLPAEGLWIPERSLGKRSMLLSVVVAAAAVLLVTAAALAIRDTADAAAARQGRSLAPLPTLARPTCPAGVWQETPSGRCVSLLPNAYRNEAYGYNLTVPGNWRVQNPSVVGRSEPGLLDRVEFTAWSAEQWRALVESRYGLIAPWDLIIEVRERNSFSASDWARTDGCGAGCDTSETVVRQTPIFVASWPIVLERGPQGTRTLRMHAFYIERGERILILRYAGGDLVEPPSGVTEATLEGIVRSIGLV
jgi:hypothetical protein